MFVLTTLEKILKKQINIFSRKCNSIIKDDHYQEERVKLTNTQLSKWKSTSKNKKGAIIRLNKKNFEDEELSHELFVTMRKTIDICNAIANNTSTYLKLSKGQTLKFS